MELTKIKLVNFKAHKDLEVDVKPGIIGVMGPNGIGKSSFLEGIYWGLTGKSLNGESRGDLKTWGATSDCYVELEFTDKGTAYVLNRNIVRNSATLTYTGNKIIGITEVSEYLTTHIGLDFDILKQVLFVGQEQLDTPLKGTESSRKDAFGKLFGCDELERLRDIVQSFYSEIQVNRLLTPESVSLLKDEIDKLKIDLDNVVKKQTEILTLEKGYPDMLTLSAQLSKQSVDEVNEKISLYEQNLKYWDSVIQKCDTELGGYSRELLQRELLDSQNKLIMINKGICPTCHTVLQSFPYNKTELEESVKRCTYMLQLQEQKFQALMQKPVVEQLLQQAKESLTNCISNEERKKVQEQVNTLTGIQNEKLQYAARKSALEATIIEKEKQFNDLSNQLEINQRKLEFITRLDKIKNAFHRDSIQKDLRTFGANAINQSLVECLEVFNVPYRVYFTVDGLAKFEDKERKQEHDFSCLSGGQKRLVSLAYRLALMRLFTNNLNICVLDEPTSFIDAGNIEAMKNAFASLSEFAQQNNMTVFIATHEYALLPIFDTLIEFK